MVSSASGHSSPSDQVRQTERVLVIDDEPRGREILSLLLTDQGYEVKTVASGRQALAMIAQFNADLILLDLRLPDVDGGLLLRLLREHTRANVIIITGYPTAETAVESFRLGVFDYLTKPIDNDLLLRTVARALAKRVTLPPRLPVADGRQQSARHELHWRPSADEYTFLQHLARGWELSMNGALRRLVRAAMYRRQKDDQGNREKPLWSREK